MSTPPERSELLERESRLMKPAGYVALLGALLYTGGLVVQQVGLSATDSDAERLTEFNEHAFQLAAGQVLNAIGLALFAFPLFFLFRAAQARSPRVRGALGAMALIGPVLFAVSGVVLAFGLRDAAEQYVEKAPAVERQARDEAATPPAEDDSKKSDSTAPAEGEQETPDEAADDALDDLAADVVEDSGTASAAAGLRLPAVLALLFALLYTSLWAMRTGLLTRFWGTLGMALGVALVLIPFGLLGVVLWFAVLGLRFVGFPPGGLPPAWEAGTAVPWSKPGDEAAEAARESVEGHGRELSERPLPENGEGGLDAPGPDEPGGPSEPPQKRKRRR